MFYWSPNRFPRRSPSLFGLKSGAVTATAFAEPLFTLNASTYDLTLASGTTFSRNSTALVRDWEGIYRTALANEARIQGARRVENLALQSEDFSVSAVWEQLEAYTIEAADAGLQKLTSTANGRIRQEWGITGLASRTFVFRIVLAKASGGDNTVKIKACDNFSSGTEATITLSTAPAIYSVSHTFSAGHNAARNLMALITATGSGGFLAGRVGVYELTGSSNTNPPEYIPTTTASVSKYFSTTNGNTVSSNVVTEAAGVSLHPFRQVDGVTVFDTYPIWTAGTPYAAGARVIPTSDSGTAGGDGYWYYASTGGTSHATTEPTWAAGPVSDGTAAWTRGGYYRIGGYLHEQSATNTVLYSGALSDVAWTKSGSSISADTLTSSAMGVADKIVEDGASSQHYVTQTLSLTGGVTYTFWAVLKADGRDWVNMYSPAMSGGAYFNVSTGTIGNVSGVTATLSPLPTGEYLCAITGTKPDTGSADIGLYLGSANGTNNYAGDGSSGIYVAHVQVNVGNFPMSPIITTSATVTRAADSLTLPSTVFLDAQGTLVADVQHALWSAAAGQVLGDGTEYVLGLATDVSGAKAYDGTNTVSGPAGTPAGTMRQAVRWASTALQVAANGTAATAGTYDTSFNLSSLIIGSAYNGLVKNLRIYQSDRGAGAALAALSAKESS